MIISRTPFRISFFGGGTDYPAWFEKSGGAVLGTSIDKYCYVSCRVLPPFFEHRIRVVYSNIELCSNFEQVKHASVREGLRFLNIHSGVEIHHDADLPARAGIGSSSAFTVGLLNVLYALQGKMVSKYQLSQDAIHVEQNLIKETVGSQDQTLTAHGGLNHVKFHPGGQVTVTRVPLANQRTAELESHLMLFYTGISRIASKIADKVLLEIPERTECINTMAGLVDESIKLLTSKSDICEFGSLLNENWKLKRSICRSISNDFIDSAYDRALSSGAIGGKLLGAGAGGFLLLFVRPEDHLKVRQSLSNLLHVPFRFESQGSQIVMYEPTQLDSSLAA